MSISTLWHLCLCGSVCVDSIALKFIIIRNNYSIKRIAAVMLMHTHISRAFFYIMNQFRPARFSGSIATLHEQWGIVTYMQTSAAAASLPNMVGSIGQTHKFNGDSGYLILRPPCTCTTHNRAESQTNSHSPNIDFNGGLMLCVCV